MGNGRELCDGATLLGLGEDEGRVRDMRRFGGAANPTLGLPLLPGTGPLPYPSPGLWLGLHTLPLTESRS